MYTFIASLSYINMKESNSKVTTPLEIDMHFSYTKESSSISPAN